MTTMKKTTFKQCAAGDVFEHQGQALIKTTKPNTAVNLNSGAFAHFHDGSLVDRSDLLICYVDRNRYRSGAANTLARAEKKGLYIVNLYGK